MTAPLIGYLDRISARAGDTVAVKVSSLLSMPYEADLVRVVSGDPNPAGQGLRLDAVPASFAGRYPSRPQAVHRGSCIRIPAAGKLETGGTWTIQVRAQPWLLDDSLRVIMCRLDAAGHGWLLGMSCAGAVFEERGPQGTRRCELDAPPQARCWYSLSISVTPDSITLDQQPLQRIWGVDRHAGRRVVHALAPGYARGGDIVIGAAQAGQGVTGVFDGRIEDPQLLHGAEASALEAEGSTLLAWWDFSIGMDGVTVTDRGPAGLHGIAVNLPTRAVRGSRWTGEEVCWRHAPRHYAAIHFHSDDLEDCGWETDFTIAVPADLPSGAYGIRLRGEGHQDIIPLYVLPPRGTATAKVAFLASSFTYQAYANHARFNCDDAYKARRAAWGAYAHNPDEHPDYAYSTYNKHPDGSGVCYSSRLRPILTWRPGFLTFDDQLGSGLRHYPADTHLLAWLDHHGIAFDVITDEDLDNEGVGLLAPYRVVLTGAHPEYHTVRTLDALQAYLGQGGRFCYLGGNGFYWRIARRHDMPHVIEVRRAEGGIRAWAAEPGEYFNALDGGLGGLWRRNGRPPQSLAGIGFSAQGLFEGSHYRRQPVSYAAENSWIFEGVGTDTFGGYGFSGGGAAGYELDRADPLQGSPPNIRILARSEGHQAHFVAVPEELLTHVKTITGEPPADLVRAEMVYFGTAQGGAVFATGSITFCGSLPHNNFNNEVSRILLNVVTRFAETPAGQDP